MDSYSVNETAAVLGIPEGRVWELLARGVLAGSTEVGGDMRVILRGAPLLDAGSAPAQHAFRHAGPTAGGIGENGGNGDSHGEQTPFRELLTEFRNLTERYGQALLALGESRGEVAALRGRVDLLEARMDHRLPWTEAPQAGWNAEALPEPETAEHSVAADDPQATAVPQTAEEPTSREPAMNETAPVTRDAEPPSPSADADGELDLDPGSEAQADGLTEAGEPTVSELPDLADEDASSPARPSKANSRSRSREAVSGFAEALARAEDPTTALVGDDEPLPGAQDIADAMAAYRRDVDPDDGTSADRSRPADQAPEADDDDSVDASPIVHTRYSTATPEPDWIAEEDLFVVAAADDDLPPVADLPSVSIEAAPTATDASAGESESQVPTAEVVEPAAEAMTEPVAEATIEPIPTTAAEPEPSAEPEPTAESDPAVAVVDPWIDDEPEPAPIPYTDAIAIGQPAPEHSSRTPIEIAAEPPAPDDVALLVGPTAFSEPPQIPNEPAFWEAGARARAPFAIPHLDAWETSSTDSVTVATNPGPASVIAPPTQAGASTAPSIPQDSEVAWGVAPVPEPPAPNPEPASTVLPGQAPIRPARTTRPRRGATARAIRRLRLLLD